MPTPNLLNLDSDTRINLLNLTRHFRIKINGVCVDIVDDIPYRNKKPLSVFEFLIGNLYEKSLDIKTDGTYYINQNGIFSHEVGKDANHIPKIVNLDKDELMNMTEYTNDVISIFGESKSGKTLFKIVAEPEKESISNTTLLLYNMFISATEPKFVFDYVHSVELMVHEFYQHNKIMVDCNDIKIPKSMCSDVHDKIKYLSSPMN